MRLFLACFLAFSLGSFVFGQETYHYQFAVQGIIDLPTAKAVKDPLRERFGCHTVFNDDTDMFDFISSADVLESEVQEILVAHGYVLLSFIKLNVDDPQNESGEIKE